MPKLKDRQYEINRLLHAYDEADDKFIDTTEMLINFASEAYETFKGSEISKKRKMLNFVFQNLKLNGQKLEFILRFPFDIFQKTTTRIEWRTGWDSNPRYGRPYAGFQDRFLKPLGHLSKRINIRTLIIFQVDKSQKIQITLHV